MNTATPEAGVDSRLDAALTELHSLLVDGETLEAWAAQRRIYALTHRRMLIAATSGRFIALTRRLFSGFDMVDLRWQDLKEARLREGLFGADLTLWASPMADLAGGGAATAVFQYQGFEKDRTREVYRLCQASDQAWREKRRVPELEQMRAQSGGIQVTTGGAVPAGNAVADQEGDPVLRLEQARQMLERKLISDAEFEALKARIIGGSELLGDSVTIPVHGAEADRASDREGQTSVTAWYEVCRCRGKRLLFERSPIRYARSWSPHTKGRRRRENVGVASGFRSELLLRCSSFFTGRFCSGRCIGSPCARRRSKT